MGFIACKHCKKFVRVPDNAPLNFDKCQNCGNILEYAGNEQELNFIMSGIEIPKIKYEKVCAKCNSVNPKETGMCFFCGSSDFRIQYAQDNMQNFNNSILNELNYQNVIVTSDESKYLKISGLIKLFALFVGLMDFLFFFLFGLQFSIGLSEINKSMFLMTNPHFYTIVMILFFSLLLSGLFVSFVLPKISYNEAFKLSSRIGIVVGIVYIYFSSNILHTLALLIIFTLITGFGGLIGEMLIHKFSK